MFVRKAASQALELWSEAEGLIDYLDAWTIDWRWLASRDEEEPSLPRIVWVAGPQPMLDNVPP